MSLGPIAGIVESVLDHRVHFAADCIGEAAKKAVEAMVDGDVLLLENTRFHAGEEKNNPDFAKALAENGDIFVNDAFSAAHRAPCLHGGPGSPSASLCRTDHGGGTGGA
jgi:phosphoglycerate kinase